MTDRTDLYRFYNADDQLLYVGISLSAVQRASQHRSEKGWWGEVARMEVEHHRNRQEAEEAERDAIRTENPIHNIVHKLTRVENDPVAPLEFAFPYRLSEYKEAQTAINRLACTLDRLAETDQHAPSRAEFITLMERTARSVVYGDCCRKCHEISFPIVLEMTSDTGCRCYYECCNHVWFCSWTTDLEILASMP